MGAEGVKDHAQVILKEEQDLEDQNIVWGHVEFLVSLRTKRGDSK